MRLWLILFAVLAAGCASLPEAPAAPERVFAAVELYDTVERTARPRTLPATPGAIELYRVDPDADDIAAVCRRAGCWTAAPIANSAGLAGFDHAGMAELNRYFDTSEHNQDLASRLALRVDMLKLERNSLVWMGRASEAESAVLAAQAGWWRDAYREERWHSRIAAAFMTIGAALSLAR